MMHKRDKRRKSKALESKSKDIISCFTDRSIMDRNNEYSIHKFRCLDTLQIVFANVNDGKSMTPLSFFRNLNFLTFSLVLYI